MGGISIEMYRSFPPSLLTSENVTLKTAQQEFGEAHVCALAEISCQRPAGDTQPPAAQKWLPEELMDLS